ncbi:TPA: hypothetical protein EYO12_00775 [Candidatus Saccharibacteria bacterium]|nr:hypothetical protein [Candidatus Saccharibacteria bacterium]HIO87251.1 hypothetical protein [Candidatus Saccharibacteria bacterium]
MNPQELLRTLDEKAVELDNKLKHEQEEREAFGEIKRAVGVVVEQASASWSAISELVDVTRAAYQSAYDFTMDQIKAAPDCDNKHRIRFMRSTLIPFIQPESEPADRIAYVQYEANDLGSEMSATIFAEVEDDAFDERGKPRVVGVFDINGVRVQKIAKESVTMPPREGTDAAETGVDLIELQRFFSGQISPRSFVWGQHLNAKNRVNLHAYMETLQSFHVAGTIPPEIDPRLVDYHPTAIYYQTPREVHFGRLFYDEMPDEGWRLSVVEGRLTIQKQADPSVTAPLGFYAEEHNNLKQSLDNAVALPPKHLTF